METPGSRYKGMDTYGSRSLAVGGVAMVMACEKVRDKAKLVAAHMLECSADDLEFTDGAFRVRGNPEAAKTIAEIALAVFAAHNLPDGDRADAGLGGHLRPVHVLVPARHAPVRRRGGHRDRAGHHPQVRGGRRRGQGDQPAHRRGPGARRRRAGHRPGAVRGGGLRRERQPDLRLVRGVPVAELGRPARRSPPTGPRRRRPRTRSASRASARRARSPPRRRWSTRSWTRCVRAACTTSRCH